MHKKKTNKKRRSKKRRTTRKIGGNLFGKMKTRFSEILQNHFGKDGNIEMITENPNRLSFSMFYNNQKSSNECFDIYIEINHIDTLFVDGIKYLNERNCLMSGGEILTKIHHAAKEMGLKYINLHDASVHYFNDCFIELDKHYILLHGYSWYNKFGYHSVNYEEELIHNSVYETRTLDFYKEKKPEICNDIIRILAKYDIEVKYESTIRNIVEKYHSLLKDETINHCSIIKIIKPFVKMLKIKYSDDLTLTL